MPHGVIFDMDGVLVDSAAPHQESWRLLARKHGRELSPELFRQSFGRTSRDIIRTIWGEDVSPDALSRYDAEKEAIYRDLIRGNVPLMPGCRELLSALNAAGLWLAVATSGPPENLDLVLEQGEIRAYFQVTVHGFDIRRGKPAPDCFQLAARRLALAPEACVVVEDAPVGIQAGVAAGMPVIALAGTHPPEPLLAAGAKCVVRQLTEVTPGLIETLLR